MTRPCGVDIGPCLTCDRVHFVCPRCEATHDRGYANGVDAYRCLRCGYSGYGFHPDEVIDREVATEIREAQAWNREHSIDPGPLLP